MLEVQQAAQQTDRANQREDREVLQELAKGLIELRQNRAVSEPVVPKVKSANQFLQKMTTTDDVEAYLTTFERTAEREGWPKEEWASLLAPFLTGEPQKAYFDLEPEAARKYDTLKAEILARLGVTTAVHAQRVHQWRYVAEKAPRSQMFDLVHLTRKWLQPETLTPPEIVERVVMDQYLRALPGPLRKWVGYGNPKTATQLVDMVERYTTATNLQSNSALEHSTAPQGGMPKKLGKFVGGPKDMGESKKTFSREEETPGLGLKIGPNQSGKFLRTPSGLDTVKCFRCREMGHVAAHCPVMDEPMQCDNAGRPKRLSFFAQFTCTAAHKEHIERQMCKMSVDGKAVTALLDSGSVVTLVRPEFVDPIKYHPSTIGVVCVHGDTRDYQTAMVDIGTSWGIVTQSVGVVPSLPYEVLVGRNFPRFWSLWEEKNLRIDSVDPVTNLNPEPFEPDTEEGIVGVPKGDSVPFPFSVMAGEQKEEPGPGGVNGSVDVPDLEVRRDDFLSEQVKDPTLARARENIKVIDDKPVDPDMRLAFPHMVQRKDLLYQVVRQGEDVVEQLLVPQPYRKLVLDLAHGHVLGGHLGVEKTKERICRRFFWPGLHADIKNYCESCPECQQSAPGPHCRSPLVPLPIIEVPFERVGMDLVGPVVKSARGHQYILVIMD
uniref:Gypsy retrotransposon integrase-like protein 1 n=1 Tax=Leptobrachium leishanense TaxID=445787 RepID=A0A8C5MJ42_9ANUR